MSEHMLVIKATMVGKTAKVSAFLVLAGLHRKYRGSCETLLMSDPCASVQRGDAFQILSLTEREQMSSLPKFLMNNRCYP